MDLHKIYFKYKGFEIISYIINYLSLIFFNYKL